MYYNDFKLLNAKLLHHYDKEQQLFSLLNQDAHIVDIEEVSKENVLEFRKYLLKICCIQSNICMKTYRCLRLIKLSVIWKPLLKRNIFIKQSLMINSFQDLIPSICLRDFHITILLSVLFHNRKIIPFTISKVKYFTRRHSYHFANSNIFIFKSAYN